MSRDDELSEVRRVGRALLRSMDAALAIVDAALIEHGASRHPLLDVLLEVRSTLTKRGNRR